MSPVCTVVTGALVSLALSSPAALPAETFPPGDPGLAAVQEQSQEDEVVTVGGDVQPPKKTKHVNPVYPPEAREARIQGVVILEAVIGRDGKVQSAKVLKSIPELDAAAMDAVLQWEFEPTYIKGKAVAVRMTVTINFTLD